MNSGAGFSGAAAAYSSLVTSGYSSRAQALAALCAENGSVGVFFGCCRNLVLVQIDQEIRLHQNLIIQAVYIGIGMMMTYQIRDPRRQSGGGV